MLQRDIHRLEAIPRRFAKPRPNERHQEAAEYFSMHKPNPIVRQHLNNEGVLTVSQAWERKVAQPNQLTIWHDLGQSRFEGPHSAPWWLRRHGNTFPFYRLPVSLFDKRVPIGIFCEVREDSPHPLGRGMNLDGGLDFSCHVFGYHSPT